MATGILSKGTSLSYKADKSTSTYTKLADLQSIPDMGGSADKVEVTTLDDGAKRYIAGIKDYGDLEFELLYDNSTANSNYRVAKGLEDSGDIIHWEVALPDGTKFDFTGSVATTLNGAGVGDAMTFKVTITLNSDISVTNPSTSD